MQTKRQTEPVNHRSGHHYNVGQYHENNRDNRNCARVLGGNLMSGIRADSAT